MTAEPRDSTAPAPSAVSSPGDRDVLGMYPSLREDHVRYLQKWGFITSAQRGERGTQFSFQDLGLLRQLHGELAKGVSFRAALRELQASKQGQLAFDFRLDAEPARILTLTRRQPPTLMAKSAAADVALDSRRPLAGGEQQFLEGSLLDDGSPERQMEAARAYRRALHENPDLVPALINLANIRYACDELPEAQAMYERAIRLDDSFFEAHFNLGNIHHDLGRHAEAVEYYRRALSFNGQYAEGHFYLAVTLEKLGRSSEARQHWRAYQYLAPDGEWVDLAKEFGDDVPPR